MKMFKSFKSNKGKLLATSAIILGISTTSSNLSAQDWSGVYIGASIGYANSDADWTATRALTSANTETTIPFGSNPKESFDLNSASFGGHIGYQWQVKPKFVAGIEGNINFLNSDDKINRIPGLAPNQTTSYTEIESDYYGDLSIKAGHLITQNTLIYGKVGIAFNEISANALCVADTVNCNPLEGTQRSSKNDLMTGWNIGLGAEKRLKNNWSISGELSYSDYGDLSFKALENSNDSFAAYSKVELTSTNFNIKLSYNF